MSRAEAAAALLAAVRAAEDDGDGDAAALLARRAAQEHPEDGALALQVGGALLRLGHSREAQQHLLRAREFQPSEPEAHNALGRALQAQGFHEAALGCFDQALHLAGDHAAAWNNRGLSELALGDRASASASLRRALAARPEWPEPRVNLGALALSAGDHLHAAVHFQEAVDRDEGLATAWSGLAAARLASGDVDTAIEAADRALALDAGSAEAHAVCGLVLQSRGDLEGAGRRLQSAAALAPDTPRYRVQLAENHRRAGRLDDAARVLEGVLRVGAAAGALTTLGHVRMEAGDAAGALESWQAAVRAAPNLESAHRDRVVGHVVLGQLDRAIDACREGIEACDPAPTLRSILALLATVSPWTTAERCAELARAAGGEERRPPGPLPEGRLRLRYLQSAASPPWMSSLLERIRAVHDPDVVQVTDGPADVIVDAGGHLLGSRLGLLRARRLAPRQLAWLGHFGTTGLPGMDGILVAATERPQGCTEPLVPLDRPAVAFVEPGAEVPPSAPPVLMKERPTLGCFSHPVRLHAPLLAEWGRRLAGHADLVLHHALFAQAAVRRRVEVALLDAGLTGARLVHSAQEAERLAAHAQIDVLLDPWPAGDPHAAFEALWMGVPVASRRARRPGGCVVASMLGVLGLDDWSTPDPVGRALAAQPEELVSLRTTLRNRLEASPLMDVSGMARAIEAALRVTPRAFW